MEMNPLLIAGVAAALLLGTRKKKSSKSATIDGQSSPSPRPLEEGGSTPPPVGGSSTSPSGKTAASGLTIASSVRLGAPWSRCIPPDGVKPGTEAVYGEDGRSCTVFWKPDTPTVVRQYMEKELESLSEEQIEALCASAPGQNAFGEWEDDENRMKFVKGIVQQLFPQISATMLPPKPESTYFVSTVWNRVYTIIGSDLCHFFKIT